jgi:hypothetical protein
LPKGSSDLQDFSVKWVGFLFSCHSECFVVKENPRFVKLLFSEAKSDYGHYLYPYVIWAVPEAGEVPADLFNAGFLPSSNRLDRF